MMKQDKTYDILVAKMHEVAIVPPQTMGPLTGLYKKIIPMFKFYPVRSLSIVSLVSAVLLYVVLGSLLVKIASILQFGF